MSDYYDKLHKKNLPRLAELMRKMVEGFFKIVSITIDRDSLGHTRVVIFFHEE